MSTLTMLINVRVLYTDPRIHVCVAPMELCSIFATGYKYFAPKGLIIRVDKTIDTERCRSHGAIISKLATG